MEYSGLPNGTIFHYLIFQKSHTCYYHQLGLHWEGFWVLRSCQAHGGRYKFSQRVSFSFKVERRDWPQMLPVIRPETTAFLNSFWAKMCAKHPSLKFVCQSNFYIKIVHKKDELSSSLTGQHNIGGQIDLAVRQEAFHGCFSLVTYWIQVTCV